MTFNHSLCGVEVSFHDCPIKNSSEKSNLFTKIYNKRNVIRGRYFSFYFSLDKLTVRIVFVRSLDTFLHCIFSRINNTTRAAKIER